MRERPTHALAWRCSPSFLVTTAVDSPAITPMSSESGRILTSLSNVSPIDGNIGSNHGGPGGGEGGMGRRGGEGDSVAAAADAQTEPGRASGEEIGPARSPAAPSGVGERANGEVDGIIVEAAAVTAEKKWVIVEPLADGDRVYARGLPPPASRDASGESGLAPPTLDERTSLIRAAGRLVSTRCRPWP